MKVSSALCLAAAMSAISAWTGVAAISDPVKTGSGSVAGITSQSGVRAFKGIPFAALPVGPLRRKEPQPPERLSGVRKGFGNACMQQPAPQRVPVNVAVDLPDSPKVSEDCLYLNVWTTANRANARLPVMVWIYGGAYTEGAGTSPHNDGEALARKGVVLVTFNYRLGPFGFFSRPELTKESGRNASGNQGLMDTIATLKWVQSNIAAFGGDPNNVTIFGESAGAAMVGGLAGSPVARSLFQRAIAESGQWMALGIAAMLPLTQAEQATAGGGRDSSAVRTATLGKRAMPGLPVSNGSRAPIFYDLTTPPPVLRTVEPGSVAWVDGTSWRHSSVIKSYTDAELASILRYLRSTVQP